MLNLDKYGFKVVGRAPSIEAPALKLDSDDFMEQLQALRSYLAGNGIKVGRPSIEDQITTHGPCVVEFDISLGEYSGFTRIRFDPKNHVDRKDLIDNGLTPGVALVHEVSVDVDDNENEDRHYDYVNIDSVFNTDIVTTLKSVGFKEKFVKLVKAVVKLAKQADRG